jgi:hypothetical protein
MRNSANGSEKRVQSVKNSLKFKAQEKEGVLSVRVGVKKYSVPVKARMLSSDEFLFLSFPASSELYRVDKKSLAAMPKNEDATKAFESLNPGRKARRKRSNGVQLTEELTAALSKIPEGFKLGYGPDGVPKLVRTRRRTKKGSA